MKKNLSYFALLLCSFSLNAQNNVFEKFPSVTHGFSFFEKRAMSDLAIDNNGGIWVTYGKSLGLNVYKNSEIGLAHYQNDSWKFFNYKNSNIPNTSLNCIEIVGNVIWVGSNKGLIKIENNKAELSNIQLPNANDSIITDIKFRNNKLYISTINSIYVITDNKAVLFFAKNDKASLICMDVSKDGIVYAGSDSGLYKISDANNFQKYDNSNSALKSTLILDVLVAKDGRIWLAGNAKEEVGFLYSPVHVIDNGVLSNFNDYGLFVGCQFITLSGMLNIYVHRILEKNDGSIVYLQHLNYPSYFNSSGNRLHFNTITGKTLNTKSLHTNYLGYNLQYLSVLKGENIYLYQTNVDSSLTFSIHDHNIVAPAKAAYLDINELDIPIEPSHNIIGWDFTLNSHISYPKNSCKDIIFSNSLLLSGKNGNDIYSSVETFAERGHDFHAGPIDTVLNQSTENSGLPYKKVWKLNRAIIEDFKLNYTKANFVIHPDILSWPAHGLGNASKNLAPFVDIDNNGLYEPTKGDYPKIKGDMCLFWITNDTIEATRYLNQSESVGKSMGVEVHAMAYGFSDKSLSPSDTNSLINRTAFFNYKVINRSANNYENFRAGVFVENELGNHGDNFVGSNPKNNFAYCYNGDSMDEGSFGYGSNPPIVSVQFLNQKMASFMSFSNDANAVCGFPSLDNDYYNYMNGNYKNGQPLRWKDKCSIGGSHITKHMFPGKKDLFDAEEWSEKTSGNTPRARRMILTSDSITLKAGEFMELEYAIAASANIFNKPNWEDLIEEDNVRIKNWYQNQNFPSNIDANQLLGNRQIKETHSIILYPNPNNGSFTLKTDLKGTKKLEVFNLMGALVFEKQTVGDIDSINIDTMAKGIYLVRVSNGETYKTIKLVVE